MTRIGSQLVRNYPKSVEIGQNDHRHSLELNNGCLKYRTIVATCFQRFIGFPRNFRIGYNGIKYCCDIVMPSDVLLRNVFRMTKFIETSSIRRLVLSEID